MAQLTKRRSTGTKNPLLINFCFMQFAPSVFFYEINLIFITISSPFIQMLLQSEKSSSNGEIFFQ